MSKGNVVRAYRLKHAANHSKVEAVSKVLVPYQQTMRSIQQDQWRRWQHGEKFWNRRDPKHIPSTLSERFKRSAQTQVVAGLESWLALAQDQIALTISHSSLPPELKQDLWYLNRCGQHYNSDQKLPVYETIDGVRTRVKDQWRQADGETLSLLRTITKHVIGHKVSVPNLSKSRTMMLDGTVAQVETSTDSVFDYWVRVSTTTKGKPVRIPLTSNKFFAKAAGDVSNFAQLTFGKDNSLKVTLVKRSDQANMKTDGVDLGLDWGLTSMFATSEGDLLGRTLFTWLKDRDEELTVLTKSLQQQKVKLSTNRRYRSLNNRIRSYAKNEVNRVLNRLLETYDIKSLTVENLDFRFGGLSKTLNRIISRAGRAAVNLKLQSLQEVAGVTVHKVNPAYTSQQCSGCGHVDKRNRTGAHFRCRFCNKSLSADVNAARNVLGRRSTGMTSLMVARPMVLLAQDHVFEHKWGLVPGSAQRLRDLSVQQPVIPTVSTVDLPGTGVLTPSLITVSLVSS